MSVVETGTSSESPEAATAGALYRFASEARQLLARGRQLRDLVGRGEAGRHLSVAVTNLEDVVARATWASDPKEAP